VSQKDAHKNAREAKALGKSSFAWAWALDQQLEVRLQDTEERRLGSTGGE
jgi:translation elongation factor EF-1alpha